MMEIKDESIEEYIPEPDSDRETLRELIAGILLMGVLGAGLFIVLKLSAVLIWCWSIGICVAVVWAVHMQRGIRAAFSMNEADAIVQMRKSAVIRYLIAVAFMVAIYFRLSEAERVYAMGYVGGIFMLKLGAYLQPFIHSVFVVLNISKPYPKGHALLEESKSDIQAPEGGA